jgi:hypothetical protein
VAEFTPDELDRLEDALEQISGPEPLAGEATLDGPLADRLEEYGEILSASRDAYPFETVDEGVLDGVLEQARAAVVGTELGRAPANPETWWTRWRAVLVPGFVLAGSAAAVLVFVRPEPKAGGDAELARAVGETPKASATRPVAALPPTPDIDTAQGADTAPSQIPERVDPESTSESSSKTATKRKAPKSAPNDAAQPEPEPAAVDKDEGWSELGRAHTLRRKGDCERASSIYRRLSRSTLGEAGRAQALGGLGLCQETDGDALGALRSFTDARKLTPEIDAWIGSQRDTAGSNNKPTNADSPPAKSKAKKSSRTKKAARMDQALSDPFE